jgi:Resolvase, N terminal domain
MFAAARSLVPAHAMGDGGGSMKVALYARVSTLNGQHPEMQLSELREYGARRGWQIISE